MELSGLGAVIVGVLMFLMVLCVALYLYITWTHSVFKKMGIPGPTPKLMGVLSDFKEKFGAMKSAIHHGLVAACQCKYVYNFEGIIATDKELVETYGRVVGTFHAREPILLISDPDIIKQICVKEFSNFFNRRHNAWPGDILSNAVSALNDDHWKHARSILSPTFSSGKMRNIVPLIHTCLDRLTAAIKDKGKEGQSVEIRKVAECFTMDVIASTGFGMDVDPHNDPQAGFVQNAKVAMNYVKHPIMTICLILPFMYYFFRLFNISPMNQASQNFFYQAVSAAIKERSEHGKKVDLLQLMLNAHKENPEWEGDLSPDAHFEYTASKNKGFTEKEILANSLVFMLAGYDTTSSLITFACHQLAVNNQCQDRLYAEIKHHLGEGKPTYDNVFGLKYLDNVINETLRLYPPATRFSRMAKEDITIKGLHIAAGMSCHFPLYTIHHDPEFWIDPEKFDPDRFVPENRTWPAYAFVPFGAGPRNCIGMRLALLEAKMALVTIVRNFDIQCGPDTEVKPKLEKGGFVRPENPLYLRFISR